MIGMRGCCRSRRLDGGGGVEALCGGDEVDAAAAVGALGAFEAFDEHGRSQHGAGEAGFFFRAMTHDASYPGRHSVMRASSSMSWLRRYGEESRADVAGVVRGLRSGPGR